ncbi:MAG: putative beta-lysine N-acetyltransferase [Desulfuromonas sp.]|nr:MAG: putative beta-lysine N-acetyltransferase [Desulfuromonas sp.]
MSDQVEKFGNSVIQHGTANDRAYVMKIDPQDYPQIVDYVVALAETKGYSKIFVKSPSFARSGFLEKGFVEEAKIPNLFRGEDEGYFFSRFLCEPRRTEQQSKLVAEILQTAEKKPVVTGEPALPEGCHFSTMRKQDTEDMAELYKAVFASYPFPIHDPAYLVQTMDENLIYFGIRRGDELIALSSAEIDFEGQNAEMTDFATLPECRGLGLATFLLEQMEGGVGKIGIKTAYTIARSYSFGMNLTFAKHGYIFSGTLVNNTQISGDLESMNVWYKPL